MKNVNIYITALVIVTLFGGCHKGPDLTPLTQEGKNTFSCKVNGKVWIPDGRSDLIVRIKALHGGFFVNAPDNTKGILISANHSNGDEMEIYLSTRHIGTHKLDSNTYALSYGMHPKSYLLYRTIIGDQLITSSKYTGELIITKADTASGIISGTFNCSLGSPSGEVITISEGRFDINSKTINL